jgi:hypothetical protein
MRRRTSWKRGSERQRIEPRIDLQNCHPRRAFLERTFEPTQGFTKPAVSSIPLPLEAILFSREENLGSPSRERGGLPAHPEWSAVPLYGLDCRSVPTLAGG